MTRNKAARSSGNYSRAMSERDTQSIYECTCNWAGAILALSFGLMFFIGLL